MTRLDGHAYATHEVLNQPPPLADYDAFGTDRTLRSVVAAFEAEWAESPASPSGQTVGSAHVQELARQANRNLPELRTHDRFGNRIDQIEFHPAWHELMGLAFGQRDAFASPGRKPAPRRARRPRRAQLSLEPGRERHLLPDRHDLSPRSRRCATTRPAAAEWAPARSLSTDLRRDGRSTPSDKTGVTVGMAMTEKQGGSDLRATTTTARPPTARRGPGEPTRSTGHKWFFSVPH